MLTKMLSKTAREGTFTSIWLALSEGHYSGNTIPCLYKCQVTVIAASVVL